MLVLPKMNWLIYLITQESVWKEMANYYMQEIYQQIQRRISPSIGNQEKLQSNKSSLLKLKGCKLMV